MGQQGRLGMTGQPQIFFRSFLAEFDQVVAQYVVGLFIQPPGSRKVLDEVTAHPDILGPLSRKHEHDLRILTRHSLFSPCGRVM